MKKKLLKDNLMQIKKTFKRFLSILLMAILGVGFFCGVKATSPDMKITLDRYFDELNVMDIQIMSTLGLNENDIEEIKKIEEIEDVMPSYSLETLVKIEDEELVMKIHGINSDGNLVNNVQLIDGKLPENNNECLVEKSFLEFSSHKIGDMIEVENENSDITLKETQLKIVGIVNSPLYISRERGSTKLGSGTINYFMYVLNDNIDSEVYTELNLTVKGADGLNCFNDEYKDKIEIVENKIEEVASLREQERYDEILNEANDEIKEAENKLNEEEQKANDEILKAEEKIENAKKELEAGQNEINTNRNNADNEFKKLEEQIATGLSEVEAGFAELEKQKVEVESKISDMNEQLELLESNLSSVDMQIESLKASLEGETDENIISSINANIEVLNKTRLTIEENISKIEAGISQAKTEISNAEQKLETTKQELINGQTELEEQKNSTYNELQKAQVEIDNGRQELQEAEEELQEEKQKAEKELRRCKS